MSIEDVLRRDNEYLLTRLRVRERQWQDALKRVAAMRAELIRRGCSDRDILGDVVGLVKGELVEFNMANFADYSAWVADQLRAAADSSVATPAVVQDTSPPPS